MDLKKYNPGIQTLFLIYNVFLAGIWVMRVPLAPAMPFMVLLHLGLACLFVVMPQAAEGKPLILRGLYHVYPFLFWALAWSEIGWLYELALPGVHDGAIKSLDLALLGIHLNDVLSTLAPWSIVREVMGLAYLSYYLLILVPPLVLALKGRTRELGDHTFGLISTYLVCFVIYLVIPVLGPRDQAQAAGQVAAGVGGVFGPLIQAVFAAGDSLGTAFPSSHCAGSVAAALLVRRHFSRTTGRLCLIWAGFIVVSTVYTNNHYAIDAMAGVSVALIILKLVSLHGAWMARRVTLANIALPERAWGLSGRLGSERKGGLS